MLPSDVLRLRLANQHLSRPELRDPARLVAHLGAVQAQDYPGARWALGQRLLDATDSAIEAAFDAGAILRTHVMRPTWHFVVPGDIRWLLALTAPRVRAVMASYDRRLGLDEPLYARSNHAIARALEGGHHLTRAELDAALGRAGIAVPTGQTLAHLVMRAELDALVCSGPRRGKQFTYALLDERVPPAPRLTREEALAELALRYARSHGPVTARDFAWWSGLTAADARRGLTMNEPRLVKETLDGLTYWLVPASPPPMPETAYLLPNYDEYTIAYKERDLYYPAPGWSIGPGVVPFPHTLVHAGRIVALWRRTPRKEGVAVELRWLHAPSDAERRALAAAADRYAAFLGAPVELG